MGVSRVRLPPGQPECVNARHHPPVAHATNKHNVRDAFSHLTRRCDLLDRKVKVVKHPTHWITECLMRRVIQRSDFNRGSLSG